MALKDIFVCCILVAVSVYPSETVSCCLEWLNIEQEFDKVYGPAWHCIVGSSFGSFVTHSTGCFLYFSMDNLYILVFKTKVKKATDWSEPRGHTYQYIYLRSCSLYRTNRVKYTVFPLNYLSEPDSWRRIISLRHRLVVVSCLVDEIQMLRLLSSFISSKYHLPCTCLRSLYI